MVEAVDCGQSLMYTCPLINYLSGSALSRETIMRTCLFQGAFHNIIGPNDILMQKKKNGSLRLIRDRYSRTYDTGIHVSDLPFLCEYCAIQSCLYIRRLPLPLTPAYFRIDNAKLLIQLYFNAEWKTFSMPKSNIMPYNLIPVTPTL